jgi:hypothetical protein
VKLFAAALMAGALVRIAALPMPGTQDVAIFRGWSYTTAVHGPARVYAWAAAPHDRSLRTNEGFSAEGDYPPLTMYALGAVGRIYGDVTGDAYQNSVALTAAVKLLPLLAEAALALVVFLFVRREIGVAPARFAVLLLWLNPAAVLATSVLGYMDAMFVLPAVAAIATAAAGHSVAAASLGVASALIKPQGIVLLPVVALAIRNTEVGQRWFHTRRAAVGALVTAVIVLWPLATAGAIPNVILAVGSNMLGGDMLSNACNLWWAIGHVIAVARANVNIGEWLMTPATVVPLSELMDFESAATRIAVRLLGSAPAFAAAAWALWTARRGTDIWLYAGSAAFIVHAYVVLTPQVHENHLLAAIPFLVLAAAGRPRFTPLAIVVSALAALNLNLLYGLGGPGVRYAIPRDLIGIDLMLLASVANCAALLWHARLLRRESTRHPELPAIGGGVGDDQLINRSAQGPA